MDVRGKASSFRLPLKFMPMLFVMLIGAPILILVAPSPHTAFLLVIVGLLAFKETTAIFYPSDAGYRKMAFTCCEITWEILL